MDSVDGETITATALAVAGGAVLAGIYFGGLWLTVRRLPRSEHPLPWYFASLLVRLGALLAGCYALLYVGGAAALLAALVGFFVTRIVLTSFVHARRLGDG